MSEVPKRDSTGSASSIEARAFPLLFGLRRCRVRFLGVNGTGFTAFLRGEDNCRFEVEACACPFVPRLA